MSEQAAEPVDLSPFDRMKDLTRRLVRVPKSELDELAEAEQSAKVKKRADASP